MAVIERQTLKRHGLITGHFKNACSVIAVDLQAAGSAEASMVTWFAGTFRRWSAGWSGRRDWSRGD